MAALLGLVTSVAILSCLLQPATTEHKKKIIVKVPHIIKHIHHDVYKPVHVHKVKAKKVEHHHEEFEEKLPKRKSKRGYGGGHKARGSYSHLQPVLLHHEHGNSGEHQQRVDHRPEQERRGRHDYSPEGYWSSENDSGERRPRPSVGDSTGERPNWEPINIGDWFGRGKNKNDGDEWLISSEDLRELREDYGILGGKGETNKGRKINKDSAKIHRKPKDINMDNDGWRPLMDFSGWKDVDELHQNRHGGYKREPIDYSGEYDYDGSVEDGFSEGRGFPEDNHNIRNIPKKIPKKKGKWSKPIEVSEPTSEEDPQMQRSHGYDYQPSPYVSSVQRPTEQPQPRRKPYSTPEPPQKKWPEHLPSPQAQQWPHPKSLSSQPSTSPSNVVWSGHHLQTPQHTMWHVQQHNVQTPVQVSASSNVPPLPILRHLQPQQKQEASVPSHQVAAPVWPSVQRTPGVTQWEQTVHMGDGDGPGSSYKVEVINYNKQ